MSEQVIMDAGDVKVIFEQVEPSKISIRAEVVPGKAEKVRQRIIQTQDYPDWVSLDFCLLSLLEMIVSLLEMIADQMGKEVLEVKEL